jgi:hypothetical protein
VPFDLLRYGTARGVSGLRSTLQITGCMPSVRKDVEVWYRPHRTATVRELYDAGLTSAFVIDYALRYEISNVAFCGLLDGRWTEAELRWAIRALGGPEITDHYRRWLGIDEQWGEDLEPLGDLLDAALVLRPEARPAPPGPLRLTGGGKETFAWVVIDTVRRARPHDTQDLFRAWRSASDGRAASVRYAAWLDAFRNAGFSRDQLGPIATRPENDPERPDMKQLAVMASLLELGTA